MGWFVVIFSNISRYRLSFYRNNGLGPVTVAFPFDLHFARIHAAYLLIATSFPSSGKKVLVNIFKRV